jgi:hypothetical protein
MASVNIALFSTNFATIRANGNGVSISFLLGSDGLALVSTVRLGLRFQLKIASLHIDEEVFDSVSSDVMHTIGQILVCNGDGKHWLLRPGRFRLYGLSESTMAASTKLAIPLRSREKLIRERGVGSREQGVGSREQGARISSPNFFEILTTMARQTYYRG